MHNLHFSGYGQAEIVHYDKHGKPYFCKLDVEPIIVEDLYGHLSISYYLSKLSGFCTIVSLSQLIEKVRMDDELRECYAWIQNADQEPSEYCEDVKAQNLKNKSEKHGKESDTKSVVETAFTSYENLTDSYEAEADDDSDKLQQAKEEWMNTSTANCPRKGGPTANGKDVQSKNRVQDLQKKKIKTAHQQDLNKYSYSTFPNFEHAKRFFDSTAGENQSANSGTSVISSRKLTSDKSE